MFAIGLAVLASGCTALPFIGTPPQEEAARAFVRNAIGNDVEVDARCARDLFDELADDGADAIVDEVESGTPIDEIAVPAYQACYSDESLTDVYVANTEADHVDVTCVRDFIATIETASRTDLFSDPEADDAVLDCVRSDELIEEATAVFAERVRDHAPDESCVSEALAGLSDLDAEALVGSIEANERIDLDADIAESLRSCFDADKIAAFLADVGGRLTIYDVDCLSDAIDPLDVAEIVGPDSDEVGIAMHECRDTFQIAAELNSAITTDSGNLYCIKGILDDMEPADSIDGPDGVQDEINDCFDTESLALSVALDADVILDQRCVKGVLDEADDLTRPIEGNATLRDQIALCRDTEQLAEELAADLALIVSELDADAFDIDCIRGVLDHVDDPELFEAPTPEMEMAALDCIDVDAVTDTLVERMGGPEGVDDSCVTSVLESGDQVIYFSAGYDTERLVAFLECTDVEGVASMIAAEFGGHDGVDFECLVSALESEIDEMSDPFYSDLQFTDMVFGCAQPIGMARILAVEAGGVDNVDLDCLVGLVEAAGIDPFLRSEPNPELTGAVYNCFSLDGQVYAFTSLFTYLGSDRVDERCLRQLLSDGGDITPFFADPESPTAIALSSCVDFAPWKQTVSA